jgi:uncharacterized protein YbaP (TraB family)
MSSSHPDENLETWLRLQAETEGVALSDEDVADLGSRLQEAREALARLQRYDLWHADLAVQPPTAGRS